MGLHQFHRNDPAIWRIFDGIIHDVIDHLDHFIGVDFHPQFSFSELPTNQVFFAFIRNHHVKTIQHEIDHLIEVDVFQLQLRIAAIHPRQTQQVIDHPNHSIRFIQRHFQKVRRNFRVFPSTLTQRFDVAAHTR